MTIKFDDYGKFSKKLYGLPGIPGEQKSRIKGYQNSLVLSL